MAKIATVNDPARALASRKRSAYGLPKPKAHDPQTQNPKTQGMDKESILNIQETRH